MTSLDMEPSEDYENEKISSGALEEVILLFLRNFLHKPFSIAGLYKAFTDLDTPYRKGLTEDKFRYALAILETEELIHVYIDDNKEVIIKGIARDGLRLLRDIEREMSRERRMRKFSPHTTKDS